MQQRRVQPSSAASAACRPPVQQTVLHPLVAGTSHAPPHMDTNARGSLLLCMAHPRRVAKVTSQMQRELGDMLANDPVVTVAICPERRMGVSALSAIASITHVYVSNDLQVVKVYVSVFSDDKGKKRAMDNLKRLEGYVRTQIGQRVKLRLTPEIRFEYDDTLEEMEMVQRVIGPEEVARYQREIEEEMAAASGTVRQDSAAAGADAGDQDGFFDGVDEGEDEDEDDLEQQRQEEAAAKKQRVPRRWTPTEQPYPDPFGDLFQGDGDQLVTIKSELEVESKGQQRKARRQGPVGAERRRR